MEVVPEVPSGMASSHVCSLDSAKATGTGHAPLEQREKNQKKKDVWCHPITTQAAADSTHGEAVGVHAFKQRGGEEQQPAPRKELKTFPAE